MVGIIRHVVSMEPSQHTHCYSRNIQNSAATHLSKGVLPYFAYGVTLSDGRYVPILARSIITLRIFFLLPTSFTDGR